MKVKTVVRKHHFPFHHGLLAVSRGFDLVSFSEVLAQDLGEWCSWADRQTKGSRSNPIWEAFRWNLWPVPVPHTVHRVLAVDEPIGRAQDRSPCWAGRYALLSRVGRTRRSGSARRLAALAAKPSSWGTTPQCHWRFTGPGGANRVPSLDAPLGRGLGFSFVGWVSRPDTPSHSRIGRPSPLPGLWGVAGLVPRGSASLHPRLLALAPPGPNRGCTTNKS